MANQQQQAAFQQQIAQIAQLHHQQQILQSAQAQNAQLLSNQQGQIQQVVLQQQQMPTVTVTSSANLGQQTLPTHLTQQGIMTKAGTQQIFQMTQPVSSHSTSIATSMANTGQIITSIAGGVSADTSNAIIGPLSSPQTPLQPPQNPLMAMSTLSASPMPLSVQKEKVDQASGGDSSKVTTSSVSITSSPLKRSNDQENDKNDSKKHDNGDSKKSDENNKSLMSSPSVKSQQTPSTPNSTTKAQQIAANNSPLATQNGDDGKKVTSNGTSTSMPLLKNELPKAMVKPNVLTHVIEGYVIQESSEPFPVTRQRYSEKENDEPPKKKQAVEETKAINESGKVNGESSSSVSSSTPIQSPTDMVACEQCGKQEMRNKLKRKKFCSVNCARLSKNTSTDGSPVVSNGDDRSVAASPSLAEKSKTEANESSTDSGSIEEHVMMKWSVTQVCDFIKNLPGCTDYAEDFALQEIDGQALLLLKENHLVSAMGMKLGPALKIVNKIESMRGSKDDQQNEDSMEQSSSGQ
jgi:polyhomeotic-like protein 1